MRKILLACFIVPALLLDARDGFRILQSDLYSITLEYTFSGYVKHPVEIKDQTWYKLYAEGCVPVLEAGNPQILRSTVSLAVPQNCIPRVEVLSSDYSEEAGVPVAPSKGSLTRNINPSEVPYFFGSAYTQNKFYPGKSVVVSSDYMLRQQHGISLSVFPLQYRPSTNTLGVYHKIIFKVYYESANGSKLALQSPAFTSMEEKEIFSHRFLNLPAAPQPNAKTTYTPISEYGSMLIISAPSHTAAMQPFIDWKNQKGIRTTMVTTAATGTTGPAVRSYIQNYYASDPSLLYVLLVGDHQNINAFNAGIKGSEIKYSDPSYGLLTGNDHYPEVMVGRFSSTVTADISTMVQRTLEYEKTPLSGNWFTKMIGIGSNEGNGYGDEGEADWKHLRNIGNKMIAGGGYTYHHEFYDSTHGGSDAPGDPTAAMVSNTVNAGASIFMYCGHGSQNSCATSNYSSSNINQATNNGKYPFSIQVACNNGTFHNGTCFSEAFIRAKNISGPTGAIASAGSTILMAWAEPMDTEDEIGDIISNQYPSLKKFTLGGIFYCGQMHMLDMYPTNTGKEVMETWVLFGDPSCMFRSQDPTSISVTHNNCIQPAAVTFPVLMNSGPNTYACLSQNNQIIGANLITQGNQNIALTTTFNPGQNLLLTITEFNKLPYTSVIPVCAPTGIQQFNGNQLVYAESVFAEELKVFFQGEAAGISAELYDLQGRSILNAQKQQTNEMTFSTASLPAGVYILKIKDDTGEVIRVQKVVKQ